MAYPCFRHYRNRDGVHYLFDHSRVWHACHTTLGSDICWDSLESHDCTCARFFRYSCLVAVSQVIWITCRGELIQTCSALTTSIMTPPFSIFARPVLTAKLVDSFWLWSSGACPLVVASLLVMAGKYIIPAPPNPRGVFSSGWKINALWMCRRDAPTAMIQTVRPTNPRLRKKDFLKDWGEICWKPQKKIYKYVMTRIM